MRRRAQGRTQTRRPLPGHAGRKGQHRQAVSYWECRKTIDPKGWAVQRMAEVEPMFGALLQAWCTNAHAREMGLRLKAMFPLSKVRNGRRGRAAPPSALDALLEAAMTHELIRMKEREAQRRARLRVTCGAKTTRKGTPCRNKSEPGRKRCKFHGGRSTGPKTAEGRERIAEAQRQRWARWREKRPLPITLADKVTVGNERKPLSRASRH